MPTVPATVHLEYKDDRSDKEYNIFLTDTQSGFTVDFSYGRTGNPASTGTKTNSPVDKESAEKIFDKLMAEKMAKGYKPSGEAIEFSNLSNKTQTNLLPQLLNPISESEAMNLINDDEWVAQEKKDGKRITMQVKDDVATAINRTGFVCGVPKNITDALVEFPDCVLDGELVGTTLWLWDLQELNGSSMRHEPYWVRYHTLESIFKEWAKSTDIKLVQTANTSLEKQELYLNILNNGKEGIVFKQKNAPYTVGRPNSGGSQLKYKLCEDVTVQVVRVNDKSSVVMGILDGNQIVEIGNVTIPPNYEIPQVGAIVDVSYLYAYKGGSLIQPVYKGLRTDHECDQITKLKYKSEEN